MRAGEGWLWISSGKCRAWTRGAVEGEVAAITLLGWGKDLLRAAGTLRTDR
jgi:hypothetical protein